MTDEDMRVCPECGSTRVQLSRSSKASTDDRWCCYGCESSFDTPATRCAERDRKPRGGLAAELLEADVEVSQ